MFCAVDSEENEHLVNQHIWCTDTVTYFTTKIYRFKNSIAPPNQFPKCVNITKYFGALSCDDLSCRKICDRHVSTFNKCWTLDLDYQISVDTVFVLEMRMCRSARLGKTTILFPLTTPQHHDVYKGSFYRGTCYLSLRCITRGYEQ